MLHTFVAREQRRKIPDRDGLLHGTTWRIEARGFA